MSIQYVEPQDPRALLELHGQEMSDSLSHSMEFSNTFFFGMVFLNGVTQRPVFVLFTKNCNVTLSYADPGNTRQHFLGIFFERAEKL